MVMEAKYTTIDGLREEESDRHLVNLAIERSGGAITDAEVGQQLDRTIEKCSRRFDGYIRGYIEVPFVDTETSLTGTVTFTNASTAVVGVGTLFETELEPGDRIFPDIDGEVECIVDTITDNTNLVLRYEYYGETSAASGAFSLRETTVPPEVGNLVRGYTLYRLWRRRGRHDDENPFLDDKVAMKELADRIQRGLYRFDTDDGTEVDEKETHYNNTDPVMDDDAFGSFIDPSE